MKTFGELPAGGLIFCLRTKMPPSSAESRKAWRFFQRSRRFVGGNAGVLKTTG
jgi:hypothetical protein